jgi:hypothetical protein
MSPPTPGSSAHCGVAQRRGDPATPARPPHRLTGHAVRLRRQLVLAACCGSLWALGALPAHADSPAVEEAAVDAGLRSDTAAAATASASPTAADPALPAPDWDGAWRDARYFLGYQIVGVAVLYLAPESISGWTDDDKNEYSFVKWRDNVTNPVWDGDAWYVNWVLHPYWGGAYYIRARERGLDRNQAFWYSAMLSAMWEYGAEALIEPVSIQDLIFTPVLGALVGEYLFTPWRNTILAKPGTLHWSDRVALVLTDPLGAINGTVDRWFGVKSSLQLRHGSLQPPAMRHGPLATAPSMPHRPASGWSVELRMQW